jgi:hypothetical protein
MAQLREYGRRMRSIRLEEISAEAAAPIPDVLLLRAVDLSLEAELMDGLSKGAWLKSELPLEFIDEAVEHGLVPSTAHDFLIYFAKKLEAGDSIDELMLEIDPNTGFDCKTIGDFIALGFEVLKYLDMDSAPSVIDVYDKLKRHRLV